MAIGSNKQSTEMKSGNKKSIVGVRKGKNLLPRPASKERSPAPSSEEVSTPAVATASPATATGIPAAGITEPPGTGTTPATGKIATHQSPRKVRTPESVVDTKALTSPVVTGTESASKVATTTSPRKVHTPERVAIARVPVKPMAA
eukprot:51499_1